jgi:hypothetical protein
MTTPPVALTIRQFLATYGVGRTQAWKLAKAGHIVTRKVGKRVLIDAASAQRWYAGLPTNETRAV